MTDELLTSFRSDVPPPDDATTRRIHARATSRRPRFQRRGLVLAVAGAAICGAAAVVIATEVFTGGSRHASPVTGEQGPAALVLAFTRDHGVLSSVTVKMSVESPNARVQLQVLHNTDTSFTELNRDLAAGNGTPESKEVVFQRKVSMTDTPPAAMVGPTGDTSPEPGWSFWLGTLSPSDWKGGCQSGFYEVTLRGPVYADGDWFRCRSD